MEVLTYPLLYYQMKEDAVLGILVGTDYQIIEKDLKRVKATLNNFLQRQYKKHAEYWYLGLQNPKLKQVSVDIRPAYREPSGIYPMRKSIKVKIPAIYGETDQGHYECYLPLFDESFVYYDPSQFNSLSSHLVRELLNRLSPEKIYEYLRFGEPQIDSISLRIHGDNDNFLSGSGSFQRSYKQLNRLCTQYPPSKSKRKQIKSFPQTAWEMEDKVAEVIEKMVNQRANLLIVGEHGVGKSAVLQQAFRKTHLANKKNSHPLTFWQLMAQRLTASARYVGEWQETTEALIEELQSVNGVLWVVNLIRLLHTGGEGTEDSVAAFLRSYLQQSMLQIVGELTPSELESMRRMLPGFTELFQIVEIRELPEHKVQNILAHLQRFARQQMKIEITAEALSLSYRLLLRYYPYEQFPGKAIKFLGGCVSELQMEGKGRLDQLDVIKAFVKQSGMPELFLRDDLVLKEKQLQNFFAAKIIGQPKVLKKMTDIVKVFKAGLNNPGQPIATMLFAGPTGVGKTASAKALADYFFGEGQKKTPLIRIDMSEFQYSWQLSRFIGSGREPGKLLQEVRDRPFSVILLDEIEKAAPIIFDTLLTTLDEGMMVDAFGRVTNFRNTIIIMTTNLGAANRQSIGYKNSDDDEQAYLSAIGKFFRPEFVNRIDHVVLFNSLTQKDVLKIARKELEELKLREGFEKRALQLDFSESLVQHLSEIGFDNRYGARPLQRALEALIVNPVARWLLEHVEATSGKLMLDFKDQLQIKYQKKR